MSYYQFRPRNLTAEQRRSGQDTRSAASTEFLRGQSVMRESGAPPLGEDYWYRCGACGNVSPANRWPGESDTLTCPVCKFVHTDSDDDPGVEDGTFEELRRG